MNVLVKEFCYRFLFLLLKFLVIKIKIYNKKNLLIDSFYDIIFCKSKNVLIFSYFKLLLIHLTQNY